MAPFSQSNNAEPFAGLLPTAGNSYPFTLPGMNIDTVSNGTLNDYTPAANTSVLQFSSPADIVLTGINIANPINGQVIAVVNSTGGHNIYVSNNDSRSAAAHRIFFPTRSQNRFLSWKMGGANIGAVMATNDVWLFQRIGNATTGTWALVSAPVYADVLTQITQAQQAFFPGISGILQKVWFADLVSGVGSVWQSGPGTVTYPGTFPGGVARLATGAGAGNFIGIFSGDSIIGVRVPTVKSIRTSSYIAACRYHLPQTDANTVLRYGLYDTAAANFMVLEIRTAAGAIGINNNGTFTQVGTGFNDISAFHDLHMVVDGQSATVFVDEIQVGNAVSIATAPNVPGCVGAQMFNNGVAVNEIGDFDWLACTAETAQQ